jgi:hypothetical protein
MSLVSAVPGQTVNTTLQLPQAAAGPVKWVVRTPEGRLVSSGQSAPSGRLCVVQFVLPSTAEIPSDGSRYSLTATDGVTSCTEYFEVLDPHGIEVEHGVEVTYVAGQRFADVLTLERPADEVTVTVVLLDGAVLVPVTAVDVNSAAHRGSAYVYKFASSGALDTRTMSGMGVGTVIWSYTLEGDELPQQELHPFYTVTPYSADFANAIRKIVDKARIGDTNNYLDITMTDLMHAVIRGADFVMQSDPVATGFALDQMPRMLRDYIIKAGAIDLLRAQYLAEGMSQGDFQGLGVQLNVDRTQYLDGLINQLTADLQTLPQAKNRWLQQGSPLGAQLASGKRPIGVLGLTTGAYSNMPMVPLPFYMMGNGTYNFLRYGVVGGY